MHAHAPCNSPSAPARWQQAHVTPPLLTRAQEALEGAARAMAQHRATRGSDGPDAEQFEAACSALTGSVMPYVAACYGRIYPAAAAGGCVRGRCAAASCRGTHGACTGPQCWQQQQCPTARVSSSSLNA